MAAFPVITCKCKRSQNKEEEGGGEREGEGGGGGSPHSHTKQLRRRRQRRRGDSYTAPGPKFSPGSPPLTTRSPRSLSFLSLSLLSPLFLSLKNQDLRLLLQQTPRGIQRTKTNSVDSVTSMCTARLEFFLFVSFMELEAKDRLVCSLGTLFTRVTQRAPGCSTV